MNDNQASFLGGFLFSVASHFKWVLTLQVAFVPGTIMGQLALEWSVKIIGTLILGIIGGIAGLMAKDIYKALKKKFTDKE